MYEVFISTKVCDMMIINDLFQFWRLCTNKPLKEKRLLQDLILKKPPALGYMAAAAAAT
jgi:hypothetical protein